MASYSPFVETQKSIDQISTSGRRRKQKKKKANSYNPIVELQKMVDRIPTTVRPRKQKRKKIVVVDHQDEDAVQTDLEEVETIPGPADQPLPIDLSSSQSDSTVASHIIDGLVTTDWKQIVPKIQLVCWTTMEIAIIISKLVYHLGKTMKNRLINSIGKK